MPDITQRAIDAVDHVYIAYGNDAGVLFGIPSEFRGSVQTIVEMAFEMDLAKDGLNETKEVANENGA